MNPNQQVMTLNELHQNGSIPNEAYCSSTDTITTMSEARPFMATTSRAKETNRLTLNCVHKFFLTILTLAVLCGIGISTAILLMMIQHKEDLTNFRHDLMILKYGLGRASEIADSAPRRLQNQGEKRAQSFSTTITQDPSNPKVSIDKSTAATSTTKLPPGAEKPGMSRYPWEKLFDMFDGLLRKQNSDGTTSTSSPIPPLVTSHTYSPTKNENIADWQELEFVEVFKLRDSICSFCVEYCPSNMRNVNTKTTSQYSTVINNAELYTNPKMSGYRSTVIPQSPTVAVPLVQDADAREPEPPQRFDPVQKAESNYSTKAQMAEDEYFSSQIPQLSGQTSPTSSSVSGKNSTKTTVRTQEEPGSELTDTATQSTPSYSVSMQSNDTQYGLKSSAVELTQNASNESSITAAPHQREIMSDSRPSTIINNASNRSLATLFSQISTTAHPVEFDTTEARPSNEEATDEDSVKATAVDRDIVTGWYPAENGLHYKFIRERSSYWAALAKCAARKSRLASTGIRNETIRTKLFKLSRSLEFWIGLDELTNKGRWVWSDGLESSKDELPWDDGQPNGVAGSILEQNCVELVRPGRLNDEVCMLRQSFLCEKG